LSQKLSLMSNQAYGFKDTRFNIATWHHGRWTNAAPTWVAIETHFANQASRAIFLSHEFHSRPQLVLPSKPTSWKLKNMELLMLFTPSDNRLPTPHLTSAPTPRYSTTRDFIAAMLNITFARGWKFCECVQVAVPVLRGRAPHLPQPLNAEADLHEESKTHIVSHGGTSRPWRPLSRHRRSSRHNRGAGRPNPWLASWFSPSDGRSRGVRRRLASLMKRSEGSMRREEWSEEVGISSGSGGRKQDDDDGGHTQLWAVGGAWGSGMSRDGISFRSGSREFHLG
jgi:hypothetical protein